MKPTRVCNWTLLALAAATLATATLAPPLGAQTPSAASSEDLFRHKCAVCHGNDGAANTMKARKILAQDHVKVKDLRQPAVQAKLTDAQMAQWIGKGKQPGMDGFAKELTPTQIQGLVLYVRSLKQ